MTFKSATILRELRSVERLKAKAMANRAHRPTEGNLKTVEFYYGAECALSWALNRPDNETLRPSSC